MQKRTIRTLVLLGLVAVTFTFHYRTAIEFAGTGVFGGHDIILQADANGRLNCFRFGNGGYGRSVAHPNVCGLIHPPVRIVTKLVTVALGTDYSDTRDVIALMVSPLAAGIASGLLFLIALELGLGLVVSSLVGILLAVSFSQVIFGSVPEFYVLGGMTVALALYVAAISRRREISPWVWILVATLAGSITITNLAVVLGIAGITFVCKGSFRDLWFSSFVSTTKIGASAVVLIVLSTLATSAILGRPALSSNVGANPVFAFTTHLEENAVAKVFSYPRSIGNSILPDNGSIHKVLQVPPDHWLEADLKWLEESHIKHIYVMPDEPLFFSRALLVSLVILGGLILPLTRPQAGSPSRLLALCGILVMLFNWLLHSVWGTFFFLYSQHWLPASILAVSIFLAHVPDRLRIAVAAFFTIAVLANSLIHLEFIFAGLR